MRKKYSLNKDWTFTKVDENHKPIKTDLPHTWNKEMSVERGLYLYERILNVDQEHQKGQLYLEFLGANSVCQVFLNDQPIGKHRGGYSTFRFDITKAYNWEKDNKLKVYVDNSHTEDVSPLNGDFTIYGGLYRSANLICVPTSHFDLLFYGSTGIILRSYVDDEGNGILNIDSHIVHGDGLELELNVLDSGGKEVAKMITSAETQTHKLVVEACRLWNGKNRPYLYQLRATLKSKEMSYDQVELTFGFRKCLLDSNKGFFLNKAPMRINGVAKHQDFEQVGNAITSKHIKKDFELIDEIGANAIRLSHYQHNQETYDLCDQQGYVTWAEIPMMSMPDDEDVLDNAKEQLLELVYQNCHHPSICFWGIQNEIAMGGESLAMYKGVQELNDLFHTIMPEEISASANMYYVKNPSPLNFITDLLGYNLYYGWYYGEIEDLGVWFDKFHEENPDLVLGISEYGADCNLNFHSNNPKVKDYSEEYQSLYHEKTYSVIESKPYLWGSFVWNMFDFGSFVRDEGGTKGKNCKGLVTFDRETKKDAFYYYKAKWSDKSFVHICEKRFVNRCAEKIRIKIYSNLNEVTLSVNNIKVNVLEGETIFCFENVPLQMGDNKIVATAKKDEVEYIDQTIFVRKAEEDASYIYVDSNPGLNVENWFTQEKSELDFFPKDYYSIKDRIGDLMKNEEAWSILKEKAPQIVERSSPGAPVTLLWIFNKMRAIFSQEEIMEINDCLTKIKKTEKKNRMKKQ
jgi:beta-galactosidase